MFFVFLQKVAPVPWMRETFAARTLLGRVSARNGRCVQGVQPQSPVGTPQLSLFEVHAFSFRLEFGVQEAGLQSAWPAALTETPKGGSVPWKLPSSGNPSATPPNPWEALGSQPWAGPRVPASGCWPWVQPQALSFLPARPTVPPARRCPGALRHMLPAGRAARRGAHC